MKNQSKENQSTARPIGVFCIGVNGLRLSAEQWKMQKPVEAPQGVLVVTEKAAFIVAPHASVALQWGAMDKAKCELIRDTKSYDSKASTDALMKAYEGTHYEDKGGKIWDVYGAPVAEWCRKYSCGNRGAGEWDLPTVAQLKVMHENRDAINECMLAIGGYRLTANWYWSSIEQSSERARVLRQHRRWQ